MKRLQLMVFALVLLTISVSNAQNDENTTTTNLEFGFSCGANYANFPQEYSGGYGFQLGLIAQFSLSNQFSIRSGLSFVRNRSVGDIQFADEKGQPSDDASIYLDFEHLTLPILAQFEFGKHKKFFFNAGPNLHYLIKASQSIKIKDDSISWNDTENYDKINLGMLFGAGTKFPVADDIKIMMELGHSTDLKNIADNGLVDDVDFKLNSFYFNGAIIFEL